MMDDVYKTLLKEIEDFTIDKETCCKKGCAFCCYQLIELIGMEEEAILDAMDNLDDNTILQVEENLNEWLDYFDKHTTNLRPLDYRVFSDFMKLPFSPQLKCPLLINNECAIYESRPITCRIHYVNDNPSLCAREPYRDSAPEAYRERLRVRNFVTKTFKGKEYLSPLTFTLARYLLPDRKVKKFNKAFLRSQN